MIPIFINYRFLCFIHYATMYSIEAYLFNDKSLNMLPTRGYTYPAAQQTVKVYSCRSSNSIQ